MTKGGSIDVHCDVCGSDLKLTQELFDKVKGNLPGVHPFIADRQAVLDAILSREVDYWQRQNN